jgi:hypothetical protein
MNDPIVTWIGIILLLQTLAILYCTYRVVGEADEIIRLRRRVDEAGRLLKDILPTKAGLLEAMRKNDEDWRGYP